MHPECGKEETKKRGTEKRTKDARKHQRKSLAIFAYTSRKRNDALLFVFLTIFMARCCVLISQIYVLQAIVAQHGGAVGMIITSKLVRDNNTVNIKSSTSLESNLETNHKLKQNMVKNEHSDSTDHISNGNSPILLRFPIPPYCSDSRY